MSGTQILVVDDEANIRELLDEILSEEGYEVTTAADAAGARAARQGRSYDLTLLDIWMPGTDGITLLKEWSDSGRLDPVIMMSGHGTVDTAVEATRLGALDFIEKPVSLTKLLRTVSRVLDGRRDRGRLGGGREPLAPVGKSEAVRQLKERVTQLARLDANVVFVGEPGSGRQLFARYLAANSSRSIEPFVVLQGRHLTGADAERQLLGAPGEPGAIERAQAGVLFIDGVDEISDRAERALLEVATQRRLTNSGRETPLDVDVRIVASRTSDQAGDIRGNEIVAALGAVVVHVPALREHSEDVPELLRFHAETLVEEQRLPFRRFSIAAQNRLRNYPWPGNVAELKEVVRHLLVFGTDEEISLQDVEAQLARETNESEPLIKQDLLSLPLREAREHFERAYLTQQLVLCGGKVGQLAKRVGMERTHLYRKLRALGVDFRQSNTDD